MYWMVAVFILVLLIFFIKVSQKATCGMCVSNDTMDNKVVIVTGSNTGIGYETAKELARRGARVILACRDASKGTSAQQEIIEATGNMKVEYKHLDLASFRSVREFAADILKTEPKLDVLINNAGTGNVGNFLTEDNLPFENQVNHYSPFLLTIILLPLLKSSAPSRIINVASLMHKAGKIDLGKFDKQARSTFERMRVYSNTKLANILFTRHLSKILAGSGVTANCLHPGAVNTDIFRDKNFIVKFFISVFFKSAVEGAQTTIYLAVAKELEGVSGKYFADCREVKPWVTAEDDVMAASLWGLSEKVVAQQL